MHNLFALESSTVLSASAPAWRSVGIGLLIGTKITAPMTGYDCTRPTGEREHITCSPLTHLLTPPSFSTMHNNDGSSSERTYRSISKSPGHIYLSLRRIAHSHHRRQQPNTNITHKPPTNTKETHELSYFRRITKRLRLFVVSNLFPCRQGMDDENTEILSRTCTHSYTAVSFRASLVYRL